MTCAYRSNSETLAELAVSEDLGEMIAARRVDDFGIEWQSSHRGSFMMNWESMNSLLDGWDGQEGVIWFFDGCFIQDGYERFRRSAVRVPPEMMREIRWTKILVETEKAKRRRTE